MLSDRFRAKNEDSKKVFFVTFLPPTIWLILFLLAPVLIIVVYSFSQKVGLINIEVNWVMDNYLRATDPLYLKIFAKSFYIAGITTFLCLVISFPVALAITKIRQNWKLIILVLLMIPFWINLLIRTYALIAVLRTRGFLNSGFEWIAAHLGLRFEPVQFLYNDTAIIIGLVYIHLPFMILPIYAGLEGFDETLKQAAKDLGSSSMQVYRHIVFPLIRPSVFAGCILVFIPALGSYLTPELLGGTDGQLIANVIERQFKHANDWPFGAALSMVLIYLTCGVITVWLLVAKRKKSRSKKGKTIVVW